MELNDLRVNLTLDNNGFRLSVAESGRILRSFEQNLASTADRVRNTEGALSSFGSNAHRFIQTMGLARFALMDLNDILLSFPRAVLKSGAEIERMTTLMEGLSTQSTDTKKKLEAASNVKFVFDMAKSAPFEVGALTDAFVKLKTGGLDPTDGSLNALVNSVAKFGGSSETLKRASVAIQQMGGKGVISMEELRQQLGEAVPSAMSAMAVGMKMSMSELTNAVSKGTVASTSALKKMLAVMTVESATASARMMGTFTGMMEQLKTEWELWKVGVADQGAFEGAKSGLSELIALLRSKDATRFGRDVGEAMSEALKTIVDFTKAVGSMWQEIKIAGEILLTYWAASKITPMMENASRSMRNYYATFTQGTQAARDAVAAEAASRRARMLANAELLEERIAQNNALTAADQARANAARAIRAEELAAEIASNRAILGVYAQRQTANQAAIAAASPSASPAVAAVARGTATAAQDLEAQVLLRHADAARVDSAAIAGRVAALQEQNIAMAAERTNLVGTVAPLTAASAAREANNAALATSALRYRAAAAAVVQLNAAMNWVTSAAASVIAGVKSMIFSMNGLVAVIMAAAWAWNYFSDKAKEAAKNAELALNAKERLKQGKTNDDTVKGHKKGLEQNQSELDLINEALPFNEAVSNPDAKLKELIKKQKSRRTELIRLIAEGKDNIVAEIADVSRKNGEADARAALQTYTDTVSKEIDKANGSADSIKKKYADLMEKQGGKLTAAQSKSQKQEIFDADRDGNLTAMKMWGAQLNKLEGEVEAQRKRVASLNLSASEVSVERDKLNALIAERDGASKARSNAATTVANMDAPNDIVAGKGPKHTTDAVLQALEAERKKVAKAKTSINSLIEDAIDVNQLRSDFSNEIDQLNANDKERGVTKKHSSKEEEQLKDLMLQAAVIDRLKSLYGNLSKQAREVNAEVALSQEKWTTGNFELKGKSAAAKVVDQLEAELKVAQARAEQIPGEAAEIAKSLEKARAIMSGSAFNSGTQFFGENKKSIESLKVGNIVNDEARIKAQQAVELKALQDKYAAQIELVKSNNKMVSELTQQSLAEQALMVEKHANDLKTPLEKLGDSWADVTKNMKDATANWASSSLDMIMNLASTGKLEFGSFVQSVLKDILKIQLQTTIGDGLRSAAKSGSDWITANVLTQKESPVGGASSAVNALSSASSTAATAADTAALTAQTAATAAQTIAMTAQTAAMTAQTAEISAQVALSAMQTGAIEISATALSSLTIAAEMAANAMASMAATQSGSTIASMFAFADGGVMTNFGPLPLRKYANGGVANSPQLALYGEAGPEAYVPLPDGRTIPVTISGGGQQAGAMPSVQVNVINQTSQSVNAQQGGVRFDGKQYILDVVMTAASSPGSFRSGMKDAMK